MTQPYSPGAYWGADVPISMPEANPNNETIVDMGDKGMGIYGLTHNISDADLEDYMMPTFQPGGTING